MKFSRRKFIYSGAALSAGAFMSAANAVPTPSPKKWDMETDVVIVGGGAGGLSAAIVAKKQTKLNVVVVEKMAFVGGSSAICGGTYAVYGTPEQAAKNINDSRQLFIDDMMKVGGGVNDKTLVEAFVDSGKIFYNEILEGELGLKPYEVDAVAGMSVPRGHNFVPSDVIKTMFEWVKKHDIPVLTNTPAIRLTWNNDGFIDGVLAKKDGKDFYIKANKAVLLASGGFSRNKEMLAKYVPLMANVVSEGGMGNTGDGILMAQAYGADVIDTPYIKATYGYRVGKEYGPTTTHIYYGGGIMINPEGKRFVNESKPYKLLADAALAQTDGMSYIVFDEGIRQERMKARKLEKAILGEMEGGKEVPWCYQGKTLEEVAKKAGFDPKVIEATVKKYNEGLDKGNDEFGRKTLTAGYGTPVKIEQGPFFIIPIRPRLIATYCGMRVTPKLEVLDVFRNPIKHLYATGELIGGVHGAAYMSGTAFGKAMAFGRLAILEIAKAS